jgi:hypothetical protein
MTEPIDAHDALVIRCPQLGGEAPFRYCRTVEESHPCRRVSACWAAMFDIDAFLRDHCADPIEDRAATIPTARGRLEMILDLVERIRKDQ